MTIHIVEPVNNFVKLEDEEWESGWWSMDENNARELIGCKIYFHKKQQEPSFFGGIITGYRIEQDAQHPGCVAFTFQYDAGCRNVKTDKHGWTKKMKIISQE
jgi:hypothetical protein